MTTCDFRVTGFYLYLGGRNMALVKCPECGRENVSESTNSCPACGFNVREHFEIIAKREDDERRTTIELLKVEDTKKRFETIKIPEKPSYPYFKFIGVFLFILIVIYGGGFYSILCLPLFIVLLKSIMSKYNKNLENYNLALKDFEMYKNQVIQEENEAYKTALAEADAIVNAPRCPQCGSINIKPISTVNRIISVGMVGLASSKIGKQYECKNCKHKW